MSTEEIDTIQQQERENNENYTEVITFIQKLYSKIMATNLSLRDLRSFIKKMDDLLTRKLIRYFKLYTTEQLFNVKHL